jgi:hypothetical protein
VGAGNFSTPVGGLANPMDDTMKCIIMGGGGGGAASRHDSGTWYQGANGAISPALLMIFCKNFIGGEIIGTGKNVPLAIYTSGYAGSSAGTNIYVACESAQLSSLIDVNGIGALYNDSYRSSDGRVSVFYGKNVVGDTTPSAYTYRDKIYNQKKSTSIILSMMN